MNASSAACRLAGLLAIFTLTGLAAAPGLAHADGTACSIQQVEGTCGAGEGILEEQAPTLSDAQVSFTTTRSTSAAAAAPATKPVTLQLFYAYDCPHCHEAMAWLPELQKTYPNLKVEMFEVKREEKNRGLFEARAKEMGTVVRGYPTFFIGEETIVGFNQSTTGEELTRLVKSLSEPSPVPAKLAPRARQPVTMKMFYDASGCVHCTGALQWLPELEAAYPNLSIEKIAVNDAPANRALFVETAKKFGTEPQGLPAFFVGDDVFYGFYKDKTCASLIDKVRELSGISEDKDCADAREISVPFLGSIRTDRVSLGQLTLVLGLLDSLNPCAIWVLTFLLSLLAHTRNRRKILMVGGTFIVMSGLVYFAFMAAWLSLFHVIGMHTAITFVLAGVAIVMGLINLKELFFFKKGVSLMIPDSAKPKIASRARKILQEQNMVLAFVGTALLAGFANIVELGCTVGLPAIFTKVLTSRGIGTGTQLAYMALYNVYYVIPLAIIVGIFVWTMGHFRVTERTGKVLKLISGVVMLALGLIMLVKPELLVLS